MVHLPEQKVAPHTPDAIQKKEEEEREKKNKKQIDERRRRRGWRKRSFTRHEKDGDGRK